MTDTCTAPTLPHSLNADAAAESALADIALAAVLDLIVGAQALAPVRAACERLLTAAAAGDRADAGPVLARVCRPEPIPDGFDDAPYPGLSLLGTYGVEAVQCRWPEGVRPEPARLASRLHRERGPLAVDCLATLAAEALEVADWGDDDPVLRGWVGGQDLPAIAGSVLGADMGALPRTLTALADRHGCSVDDVAYELAAVITIVRLPNRT